MGNILWEIQKTCWDYQREYGDTPREITLSRRAYETLIREAGAWVYLRAETKDGVTRVAEETVYGMKIKVGDDTGSGFFCLGGTTRLLNRETGGQENVSGTD